MASDGASAKVRASVTLWKPKYLSDIYTVVLDYSLDEPYVVVMHIGTVTWLLSRDDLHAVLASKQETVHAGVVGGDVSITASTAKQSVTIRVESPDHKVAHVTFARGDISAFVSQTERVCPVGYEEELSPMPGYVPASWRKKYLNPDERRRYGTQ